MVAIGVVRVTAVGRAGAHRFVDLVHAYPTNRFLLLLQDVLLECHQIAAVLLFPSLFTDPGHALRLRRRHRVIHRSCREAATHVVSCPSLVPLSLRPEVTLSPNEATA